MPMIFEHTFDGGIMAIWHYSEPLEELEALCSPEERERARAFPKEARQREWLAWHALLHRISPGAVATYDTSGAPILKQAPDPAPNRPRLSNIGVSHTDGHVAVIVADRPCAVDLELPGRDFSRAAARFVSDTERALINKGLLTEGAIWCAKEAMFKWIRTPGTDFLRDMAITAAEPLKTPIPSAPTNHSNHSNHSNHPGKVDLSTLSANPDRTANPTQLALPDNPNHPGNPDTPGQHNTPAHFGQPDQAAAKKTSDNPARALTGSIRGRTVTLHDLSTEELTIIFCCE